jgi:hypothetical protein
MFAPDGNYEAAFKNAIDSSLRERAESACDT